jgi:nicotinamide-nucleotide amidase
MTLTLLTIGDELLIGQVVNTNAAWIGEQASALGLEVRRAVVIGDDEGAIAEELLRGLRETGGVLLTGGLGPTHDDVTKRAVASALGRALEFRADLLAEVRRKFEARGRRMAEANRLLAEVPEGFEALPNPVGTAPGLWYAGPVPGAEGDRFIAVVPGVPYEMKTLLRDHVLPRLVARQGETALVQKTLLTVGAGESDLAERLEGLDGRLSDRLRLAFLPNYGTVRLRITALGETRAEASERLADLEGYLRERLGEFVFGEGEDSLAAAVGRMLAARGLTLAVAESCTGGRLADAITDVPGASAYFRGGAVVYGNDTKVGLLDVDEEAIVREGAVSEAVARQLAEGVRQRLSADLGLSATGIAGPGGGTPEKPVGTVWLGFADDAGTHAVHLQLTPDRHLNKRLTTTYALDLLRRQVLRRD